MWSHLPPYGGINLPILHPANLNFMFSILVIFSSKATPLPIPNREVKLASTDDSQKRK